MAVTRPELVLAAAVGVSLPMAPGIVDGGVSPDTAAVRFLIALVICWAGASLLSSVTSRYSVESRRAETIRMIEAARRAQLGALAPHDRPAAPAADTSVGSAPGTGPP